MEVAERKAAEKAEAEAVAAEAAEVMEATAEAAGAAEAEAEAEAAAPWQGRKIWGSWRDRQVGSSASRAPTPRCKAVIVGAIEAFDRRVAWLTPAKAKEAVAAAEECKRKGKDRKSFIQGKSRALLEKRRAAVKKREESARTKKVTTKAAPC